MNDKTLTAVFGTAANEFKTGDRVILPSWFKLTQRQARVNIILGIHPRKGYIFMAKMLKSGEVSTDRKASIYFPHKHITSLRKL